MRNNICKLFKEYMGNLNVANFFMNVVQGNMTHCVEHNQRYELNSL